MKEEDKNLLKVAHRYVNILSVLLALACVAFGVYLCADGNWSGLLLAVGGALVSCVLWALARLFILHVKNVQDIRDRLCADQNDENDAENSDKG